MSGADTLLLAPWRTERHRVWPSIGGHNISLVARIGDWTWQAVADAFQMDVLRACTDDGAPAYLSFHYCRYRASQGLHLRTPTFGDHLTVSSLVTSAGPQSTLTLHRVRADDNFSPMSSSEFCGPLPAGEMRVEHLNRWITPLSDSNNDLASTTPVGFDPGGVVPTPPEISPRARVRNARQAGSFRAAVLKAAAEPCTLRYEVDAARDLNAVGLMYFAAYSGVIDWALWRAWRHWSGDEQGFLARVVLDQQILYEGNADAGSLLEIVVQRWNGPNETVVDITVTRHSDGKTLCISTLSLQPWEDS